jgi:TolB-like protein/tetratricopeptide (TPR) repeat protein
LHGVSTITHTALVQMAPSADDVRAELDRILSSPHFEGSNRRRAFLRFVAEETLSGRGERLKGYTIAVTVFGRDETFDNQTDPVVRLEARRLRRDLDSYYVGAGSHDPVRISIPKGSYVPHFEWHEVAPPLATYGGEQESGSGTSSAGGISGIGASGVFGRIASVGGRPARSFLAAAVVAAIAAAAVAGWILTAREKDAASFGIANEPAVVVMPFEAQTSNETGRLLAAGLTNSVVDNLIPFDGLQVLAGLPTGVRASEVLGALAAIPVYVISGSVEQATERLRVMVRLTERASGRVLWSQSFDRRLSVTDVLTIQDDISTGIASRLAQVYGLIHLNADRRLADDGAATLGGYTCVQRAFAYRLTFDRTQYPAVRSCLEAAVQQNPDYADAWAMLAFAHLDAVRFHLVSQERTAELAKALSAAQRSVDLAPERVRPLQALAAVRYMRGDFAAAERIQRHAIKLNPNDPESSAQLGWRLAVRGHSEQGIALLRQAITRSVRNPAWYNMALAIAEFAAGDLEQAYAEAVRGQNFCCGLGKATLAAMAAEVGKPAEASEALEAATAQSPLLVRDPHAFWATWHFNEALIGRLNAGLEKAGLSTLRAVPSSEPGQ